MITKKVNVLIIIALTSLFGLSIVQAYLLYTGLQIEQEKFDDRIDETLLDIHHNVEDDKVLSGHLIRLLKNYEEGKKNDTLLLESTITEVRERIDSISNKNGINLTFDFVLFDTDNQKNIIESSQNLKKGVDYQKKSIKAGWRIRESLGEGRYRIGLYYYNDFIYLFDQVKFVLIFSLILFLTLFVSMFFIIRSWKLHKQNSELKNQFINNLTHELKTPVFSMSLIHNILKEKMDEGKDNGKYLSLLESETSKLKSRIEKVLDMSMMEHHRIKMNFEEVELGKYLQETIEKYDVIISSSGGELVMDLEVDEVKVHIDRMHFESAITNIIDNAIKYSEGPPQIKIMAFIKDEMINIKICDQGIGIPGYAQKMIFDRFYRVSSGNLHNVKGLGIGLSYVKMIVDEHGGRIEVKSRPGQGSEFTFLLRN